MGETGLEKVKTVLRVTSGNFLEMYDFFLFGIYARQIAHTFFPNDDPYASLMLTFLSFAAGFAMRPIGALVLGPYIDRIGRRQGLIVTLSIMACGTILIAFVPGYATIGVAAPLLVVLGRLLQGFSAGVELGGVSVYLSEMATPGHKGFYVSWQSASQQVAVMCRRAPRLYHRQPDVAAGGGGLGLAHPLLHRLRYRPVPLLDPPLAAGDGGIRQAKRPSDIRPDLRDVWPRTGR